MFLVGEGGGSGLMVSSSMGVPLWSLAAVGAGAIDPLLMREESMFSTLLEGKSRI